MCEAIRKIRAKGIAEGIAKGKEEGRQEGIEHTKHDVAVNALQMKLSIKTIQKLTGLSQESIRIIAQSIATL